MSVFARMLFSCESRTTNGKLFIYYNIHNKKKFNISAALGLRFSRACRVCHTEAPRERSACKPCGEAVCRECADASAEAGHQTCPKRREETGYVTLYEAVEERNEAG